MRKTSYALTALAVVFTTVLAVLSLTRVDWVTATYQSEALNSSYEAKYGLTRSCARLVVNLPGRGSPRFENYECRPFPTRDEDACNGENRSFCAAWTSAGYMVELSIGFGALALVAIAIGVSTHSRRRRIWRAAAGLVVIHALLQLVAFSIVVDLYRTARYRTFQDAKLGTALWLDAVAWVAGILTGITTIVTGMAADRGKHWAAGNRAYQPIEG